MHDQPPIHPGLSGDGQQAIRDYSRRVAASALRIDDLDTVAVHHTGDPDVLIV